MGKKDEITKTLTATSIKTKDLKFNREEANSRAMRLENNPPPHFQQLSDILKINNKGVNHASSLKSWHNQYQ